MRFTSRWAASFPHPLQPAGRLPVDELRNLRRMHGRAVRGRFATTCCSATASLRPLFTLLWNRTKRDQPSKASTPTMRARIKQDVTVPVICTGGFQTASVSPGHIGDGDCDGVTHRPAADRQQRPACRSVRRRHGPAAALHLLQQVPAQRPRESARLLRASRLRRRSVDGRRDDARLPCPDAVPVTAGVEGDDMTGKPTTDRADRCSAARRRTKARRLGLLVAHPG